MTDVDACEADQKAAVALNCDLAAMYAKVAYDHSLFQHISTDHLFDGLQPMLNENTPGAINNYGFANGLVRKHLKAHQDALILRKFGWGPAYRHSFSDWIIENLYIPITLYDNVYFTPLYVGDMIDLAHQLIDKNVSEFSNLTLVTGLANLILG